MVELSQFAFSRAMCYSRLYVCKLLFKLSKEMEVLEIQQLMRATHVTTESCYVTMHGIHALDKSSSRSYRKSCDVKDICADIVSVIIRLVFPCSWIYFE